MEFFPVIRDKTFFSNSLLEAYYKGDKLRSLYTYTPDMKGIGEAIKGKSSFSQQKRNHLVQDLYRQYDEADINLSKSRVVQENIDKLKESNTFTITTGQQIHLGLGPVYVLYKVFDAIALSSQLNKKFQNQKFVPIFWMASEDHDLEEIASISFFGNQVKWDTNQSGAVGRMNTKGVAELFQDLIDKYQLSDIQQYFLQRAVQIYRQSENLAIAFRKLLHDYLGHTGLIILDADSKLLKSSFSSVMIDELNYRNNQAIIESSQKLEKAGFKRQLRVRSCNLFLLQKNDRVRIDDLADFSGESPVDFVKENYNSLSPNAALRPLYQEWILPNVCTVLGSSELNYWLQLKGLFDNYEMPLPSMIVRTSAVLIPFKFQEKYFNNDLTEWFEDENAIALKHDQELAAEKESHDQKLESIKSSIRVYDQAILETFKGVNLGNKWSKLMDKLSDIQVIMDMKWSQRIASSADLKKVLKIKRAYFNPQHIQERTDHIVIHTKPLLTNLITIQQHFGIESNQKVWIIFY